VVRGDHGCDYALELKLPLFADRAHRFGGSCVEQQKDHVVAGYQDRADVCDMGSAAPCLRRALRELLGGMLHSLGIDVWPETLDQECGVRDELDHRRDSNPARTSE